MRVHADGDICIAAGMCVMATPAVFDQDDDGIVVVVTDDVPADDESKVRVAVSGCPSGALTLAVE